MKITTPEEREAHGAHVAAESIKGTLIGGLTSSAIYLYIRRYRPAQFRSFSTSVKACLLILPTIGLCSFWAEEGSREFDMKMHSELGSDLKLLQEYQDWKHKSIGEQVKLSLLDNKFKILFGLYGASFFAVQELSRGKIGPEAQALARRNYSLGFAAIFLSILIGLSRPEKEAPSDEWKKYLKKKQ
ncbi:respiratory supercomplex factor 2, mitochondrial [[Candida] railenensis]|uniref:Respiratory supercomplex factor 2, mitochondrial n=1 Tax=[Candida] railenensis TaxID=45579 RepID=A0A9P0VXI5_9ASCO|nr:respiratory supercomplex factor 2, mitochondrial [[Candida] railenensis]